MTNTGEPYRFFSGGTDGNYLEILSQFLFEFLFGCNGSFSPVSICGADLHLFIFNKQIAWRLSLPG